jgi:Na+-driven multidrug efflux pump
MSATIASFPFNALLLGFGTEVNAAYHISRRMYQQLTGPLYRSYSVAASVVVGQTLGEGDPAGARFNGFAIAGLALLSLGFAGAVLVFGAEALVLVFTRDPETVGYAVTFARVFGLVMAFFGLFFTFAGALRGAGDTRTPFYARLTCTFGFMFVFSSVV